MVAELEINFSRMIIAEIHERVTNIHSTYPFPCVIFMLFRDARVQILHSDKLRKLTGTLDIGVIKD